MQLTMFSDYALRVIMRLSEAGANRRWTAGDMADNLGASRAHIAKVVTRLVDMGLLESTRGRGGGISMADGAEKESVGAILRQLETGEVVDCVGTNCPLLPGCGLRPALAQAQEAFFATLDPLTIEDVARPRLDQDLTVSRALPLTPL